MSAPHLQEESLGLPLPLGRKARPTPPPEGSKSRPTPQQQEVSLGLPLTSGNGFL
jgi:hypothetical protein